MSRLAVRDIRMPLLASHRPADPVARMENGFAELMAKHPVLGTQAFEDALAEAALPEYARVAALLHIAETDDADAYDAIFAAISLDRTVSLLGANGASFTWKPPATSNQRLRSKLEILQHKIKRSFKQAWANLYASAKRRCVADHEPGQSARIMSIGRQMGLLNMTDEFSLQEPGCVAPLAGAQDVAAEGSAVTTQPAAVGAPHEGTGTLAS